MFPAKRYDITWNNMKITLCNLGACSWTRITLCEYLWDILLHPRVWPKTIETYLSVVWQEVAALEIYDTNSFHIVKLQRHQ